MRVMRAVDELGYVPNLAARALVTRRTGAIALVISESEERIFGEPFFAGVVRGITTVVGEASRQLVLSLVADPRAGRAARLLPHAAARRRRADALAARRRHPPQPDPGPRAADRLLWPPRPGRPDELRRRRQHRWSAGGGRAPRRARPRRRSPLIAGPQDMIAGRDRLDGYRRRSRPPVAGRRLAGRDGDFSEASGAAAMAALLERRPDLDAVFAASDPRSTSSTTRWCTPCTPRGSWPPSRPACACRASRRSPSTTPLAQPLPTAALLTLVTVFYSFHYFHSRCCCGSARSCSAASSALPVTSRTRSACPACPSDPRLSLYLSLISLIYLFCCSLHVAALARRRAASPLGSRRSALRARFSPRGRVGLASNTCSG